TPPSATATYPLSLHDALPIFGDIGISSERADPDTTAVRQFFDLRERQAVDIDELRRPLDAHFHQVNQVRAAGEKLRACVRCAGRSEEHTSELQSLRHLVCRLL